MARRDIVVIGASAGGTEALMELASSLPRAFAAPVFIVRHQAPYEPGYLPEILAQRTALRVGFAKDGERIEAGRVYVAPPDRHMLIDHHRLLVRKGPKENRFRPSIDALFRSAAYQYGSRVIGVVLSGALDDGTSGMWSIKHRGGTTVVQDPSTAIVSGMPESVLQHVRIDHIVPIAQMAALLTRLVRMAAPREPALSERVGERMDLEVGVARGESGFEKGTLEAGAFTPFTCPECHGALVEIREGGVTRFRCHTGHAYTSSALLASVTEAIEETLWQSMQRIEEATMLLNHFAEHFDGDGDHAAADLFHQRAHEAAEQARVLHTFIESHERFSADSRRAARTERTIGRALRGNGNGRRVPSAND